MRGSAVATRLIGMAVGAVLLTACALPTGIGASGSSSTPAQGAPTAATATINGIATRTGGYAAKVQVKLEEPASMGLAANPDAARLLQHYQGSRYEQTAAVVLRVQLSGQDATPNQFKWPDSDAATFAVSVSGGASPAYIFPTDGGLFVLITQEGVPLNSTRSAYVYLLNYFSPAAPNGNRDLLRNLRLRIFSGGMSGMQDCQATGNLVQVVAGATPCQFSISS